MNKGSFIGMLPIQLRNTITDTSETHTPEDINDAHLLDGKSKQFLMSKLVSQKGIIFTEFNDIQLKLFDVDSTLSPTEFDQLSDRLDPASKIVLCEKVKLIYGFNSLTPFIIRLVNILNFSTFFSIFDITSNIKLYGFYSLNYTNPVEILVKQIRHDLFIVKSFKEFTIQEMKKEHDFHLPYKEFKRLNLNDGNLVVVKILFKNEQKPIDLAVIKPLLPKIKLLHLSLESETKLKPFNELIDLYGTNLKYLKFGVNRGTFKKIPIKNDIQVLKLVNIDNLNFINDLKGCQSLDVFFDNWELRKNCDVRFQQNFIIKFDVRQRIESLRTLNIFHTYLNSKDLNKLKLFPNLTYSKISYVILDNDGFDMSECKKLQELKIHFTYQKPVEEPDTDENPADKIQWPPNCKKLSITIHNIKNLVQNFSIRLNILKKIAKPLPPSIVDLCIDISYDTGGSGPELYSISRDDILKISMLINQILTNNLENLKLKGISRYNYKIGKPLIFSAINFPPSLKLLSLNDFILDYNFISLPKLKKLYFEHSLFDSDFRLPDSDEILIEKCTFKDLAHLPTKSSKIEFKMCTFRKIPSYNGDVSNVVINNCRVMEQPTNNIFQFQQQLQLGHSNNGLTSANSGSSSRSQSMQRRGGKQRQRQSLSANVNQRSQSNHRMPVKSFVSAPQLNSSDSLNLGRMEAGSSRSVGGISDSRNGMPHSDGTMQPMSAMFTSQFIQQQQDQQPRNRRSNQKQRRQTQQQQQRQQQHQSQSQPQLQQQAFPQFPMFPSASLGSVTNSSAVMTSMKPSSSMDQVMNPSQKSMAYDYNYFNDGRFSNFIDNNLGMQLNGLSLSNTPYLGPVTSTNLGRNTQEQRINSPPLASLSMAPSGSSARDDSLHDHNNIQPISNSHGPFDDMMTQLPRNSSLGGQDVRNGAYDITTSTYGIPLKNPTVKGNFNYFPNESNYIDSLDRSQAQQKYPQNTMNSQGQVLGQTAVYSRRSDEKFNGMMGVDRTNSNGVSDSF